MRQQNRLSAAFVALLWVILFLAPAEARTHSPSSDSEQFDGDASILEDMGLLDTNPVFVERIDVMTDANTSFIRLPCSGDVGCSARLECSNQGGRSKIWLTLYFERMLSTRLMGANGIYMRVTALEARTDGGRMVRWPQVLSGFYWLSLGGRRHIGPIVRGKKTLFRVSGHVVEVTFDGVAELIDQLPCENDLIVER